MTNTYRTRDEPTQQDCPKAQYPSALHHDTRTHLTLTTRDSTRSTNTPPTLIGSPNRHRRTPTQKGHPNKTTPRRMTHTQPPPTHIKEQRLAQRGHPQQTRTQDKNYLTDPRPPNAPLLDNHSLPPTPTDQ
ncbi:Hypothetical predicted protein [Pelobates cultripes]|uniref:Uncharacterized protein n=1 Tax=Pelobates cultripes TaxID=61616 RepID=A0AAD1VKF1_PELCU|nr:Hypothetical predicted protein [Pelobates cultripes]